MAHRPPATAGGRGRTHGSPEEIAGPGHPIALGCGLLDAAGKLAGRWAPAHRYAIITDSRVGPLYGERVLLSVREAGLEADVFTFPAGEAHKTRDTWTLLTDEMLAGGFGRDSAVIALGGGVVGDLGGFVAATYMRGVPVIQIPTSLLAMVDSSIGGKTGVDAPAGKNMVGVFHLPAGVLIDPQTLETLSLREFQSGLAEILKYGAIADASYFGRVAAALPGLLSVGQGKGDELEEIIRRGVALKSEIVAGDVRESGIRKILNFGHTVGHAIEKASDYSLLHGEAVAIGMVAEAAASERAGTTERGTADELRRALAAAGLPVTVPATVPMESVLEAMRGDKKKRADVLEFAVPKKIGSMAGAETGWTVRLSEALIPEVLR